MGVLDFDGLFSLLDPRHKGYLTADVIQQYDEALHFTPLCLQQIEGSIRQMCGPTAQGCVTKDKLLLVLQDLERRRSLEEQLRWDFMGLDQTGNAQLPLKQVLLLFSMVHGDAFSMQTWQMFLDSRGENVDEDVYFDEVKVWLCGYPDGPPATTKQLVNEQDRLDELKIQQTNSQLFGCIKMKEMDELQMARDKKDYNDQTRKLAKRKFNRWEKEGIEGLLYDDGIDHGDEVAAIPRSHIGITEVTEALQLKYDLIRKKLFWDMLKHSKGESMFNQMSDTDKIDLFQQLQMHESQMREEGFLDIQVTDLPGAHVPLECKLQWYIGELRDGHEKRNNNMYTERLSLRAQKKSDAEVDKLLKEAYDKEFKGPVTYADMLIELDTRFLQEKQWIISKLRSDTQNKWTTKKLLTEYGGLIREHMMAELEDTFYNVCLAVGLAEREQHYKSEKYDPDRIRQEQLAKSRLLAHKHGHKYKFPYEDGEFSRERSKTAVEAKLDIVKEIVWKHIMERENLIELLQGPDSAAEKQKMSKMSEDQRTKHLTSLRNRRNKWREYTTGYRISQKNEHTRILQEGAVIYYENSKQECVKSGEKGVTDERICTCVLADLQQKQDIEFTTVMLQIQAMGDLKDLQDVKAEHKNTRREEVFDNIAGVVLGTERWTEEEIPFMEAVEAKYNALRRLLFCHVLELEHGVSWHRLAERDRQRLLDRKSTEEQKLRDEGQLESMASLIQRMPQDTGSLRSLMGEDRAEYIRRMRDLSEMIEQSAVTGQPLNTTYQDEKPAGQVKSINLLADMIQRAHAEEDAVVGQMRMKTDVSLQERLVPLVQLKVERRRAEKEEQFDVAAFGIGMLERIVSATDGGFQHQTDHNRQLKLAFVRVAGRRRRLDAGRHHHLEVDESRPESGEVFAFMEAYIKERDKKHAEEREILLQILQDPSFEDLSEAAKTVSDDEKHKRLAELQVKRRKMDMHSKDHQDENISVLEEAAAIRYVLKKAMLEKEHKQDVTKDEVFTNMLAAVQDEQDKEMGGAVSRLGKMDLEDLDLARTLEIESRHWGSAENVVYVLTQYEGSAQDKQLLKALDEKYDAIREQMFKELLTYDQDYSKYSGPEKHRKLMQMKIHEQKLRKDGNYDEIRRLVGMRKENEDQLYKLLGETRTEYEKRLKKIYAGIPSALEEEEGNPPSNVFEMLQERYQIEKDALLTEIRGMSGVVILGERQREVKLVRLQYEMRIVINLEHVSLATLAVGLAERQQSNVDRRNKSDRWRQEKLSRLRLDNTTSWKVKGNTDIVKQGGGAVLKEAVLLHLHEKHLLECQLLLDILSARTKGEHITLVQNMSEVERQNRAMELKQNRQKLPIDKTKEQHSILLEASLYKKTSRSLSLSFKVEGGSTSVSDTEVIASFLADLQERQYMETEQYLQKMAEQDENDLIVAQTTILHERKIQLVNNVADVLLSVEESKEAGDHELIQALENKYDTLRDKVLAEALMAQMGESEWKNLSERDRQRKLVELRMKERKLRQEGREEEANQLLGDAIKNSENLQKLLGMSRAEYDRRLAERKAKRLQRLKEGFTEEEVKQLEEEEDKEEKKSTNIMADLDACFEKEKEALLKNLSAYREGLENDKARQLELARLKREQRRAREEKKFSAAALYISMANEQKEKLEDHRQRQEQLAKERLAEKMKQRKEKKQKMEELTSTVPLPEDQSDTIGWIEAITMEVELKHNAERDFLIELLKDPTVEVKREDSRQLNKESREMKLEELRLLRDSWKDSGSFTRSEHVQVLKEATGITLEMNWEQLVSSSPDSTEDTLQVAVLANLQEQQDAEMAKVIENLNDKSVDALKQLKTVHQVARRQQWYDNVAVVVMKYQSKVRVGQHGPGLKEVLDALEKKYDVLTDKLMEKVLKQQLGEDKWQSMSETERQTQIIKLKLKNRQLRHQGKRDEANQLFGDIILEPDLLKKLGPSRSQQRRKKEERLQLKKQLVAERKQQSLSVDEALLEALLDEEMRKREQHERGNVLEQLQEHFDDEKDAVESSITNCDSGRQADTLIQLELARLVREKKLLAQEEDFGAAAALFNLSQQQTKDTNNADKQKAVALGRLRAKMNKTEKLSVREQLQQEEQQRQAERASIVETLETQDVVSLQASILSELALKQEKERQKLVDLLYDANHDHSVIDWASNFKSQDRKFELEKLRQVRTKWKTRCLQRLAQNMEANKNLSNPSHDDLEEVVNMRHEQDNLLLKAVTLRLHVEKEELHRDTPTMSNEEQIEEVCVNMLVELQQKQGLESNAVNKVTSQQANDEFRLKYLLDTQISSTREMWLDNLVSAVFTFKPVSMDGDDDDNEGDNEGKLMDILDEELRQEKDNLITQLTAEGKSQETMLHEVRKLEQKHEERRQALVAAMEKQKAAHRAKQEARRQYEANREYEDEITMQLSKMSNREMSFIQKINPKFLTKDLMAEKIQERREARQRARNVFSPSSGGSSREGSARARSRSLPGFNMKREKTVIDVSLTDDQISEKQKQLMRDAAARNRQIAMEQRIHEERLQKRLQEMKQKRHMGVQEIFSTMERQRSDLAAIQKDERARQLQKTREDVERHREQRTKDMKEKDSKNASQFQNLQSRIAGENTKEDQPDMLEGEGEDQGAQMTVPSLKLVAKEGVPYSEGDPLLEKSQLAAKRKVKADQTQYDIV